MTRILVVDDDINIRIAMKLALSGYDVLLAEDGLQALSHVQWQCPDLILMDIMMPNLDGIIAAEIILTHYSVPILFVSGVAEKVTLPPGLSEFSPIQKPFEPMDLLGKIGFALMKSVEKRRLAQVNRQVC